jgi:nicotinate-nucleotide pyrophosphorylase (carboxylating)
MSVEFDRFDLVRPLIDAALAEDVGSGDATTLATVPTSARGEAEILVKEEGVVCGLAVARAVFDRVEPTILFEADAADGDSVAPGQVVARITGPARGLLTAERTALNFLQHLSGIATATRRATAALEGTGVRVLDTRKTVPGMRLLAKYAVRCGGGENHRQGLYDMILIKENHIAAAGSIAAAVRGARESRPDLKLEVEVTTLEELDQALRAGIDRIMLDNFTPERVGEAVLRIASWSERAGRARPEVEISGRITVETARSFALPGVDFMSSGALTHSVKALDLSMELRLLPSGGR